MTTAAAAPLLDATIEAERGTFRVRATVRAHAGRPVALVGPNGAGKSTVVAALAGLEPLRAGRVVLEGDVLEDPGAAVRVPSHRRPVGVVFQDLRLFPHLSALENVAFPLRAGGRPRREARAAAASALEEAGLAHRARARPADLSGGEAQRVALARALVRAPRLLLLDEPLSALDTVARREVRTALRRTLAAFDGASVLVTHDPVEALTLADDLVLMEGGRVTQAGSGEQIRSAPRTAYAAELVGINLFSGRLERLPDGSGLLRTPRGDVDVGWLRELEGPIDAVLGLLRPADVSLYRTHPGADASARNVVHGRVQGVTVDGDRARIRIDSAPPLLAEVTAGSVARLGLVDGVELWASFKAVEVTLVLP
jgi:molybdate transport system ATP-binding protein